MIDVPGAIEDLNVTGVDRKIVISRQDVGPTTLVWHARSDRRIEHPSRRAKVLLRGLFTPLRLVDDPVSLETVVPIRFESPRLRSSPVLACGPVIVTYANLDKMIYNSDEVKVRRLKLYWVGAELYSYLAYS